MLIKEIPQMISFIGPDRGTDLPYRISRVRKRFQFIFLHIHIRIPYGIHIVFDDLIKECPTRMFAFGLKCEKP